MGFLLEVKVDVSVEERLCENVDENGGCIAEIRVFGQRVGGVACQWVSVVEQVLAGIYIRPSGGILVFPAVVLAV
jgi:hypothetical protein